MLGKEWESHSLIGAFREATVTVKGITCIVILAFGGLMTSPAVAAVRQEVQKIQWRKSDNKAAELSKTLKSVHNLLNSLPLATPAQVPANATTHAAAVPATLTAKQIDTFKAAREQLKSYHDQLKTLDQDTLNQFASVKAHLLQHHLPQVILDRQANAVATYKTRMASLMTELNAADAAPDNTTLQQHLARMKAQLDKQLVKPIHEKFDPNHLPFSVAKPKHIKPRLTRKAYEATLFKRKPIQVASIGSMAGLMASTALPSDPNDPRYLAPTDDVQITDAIKAKAAELHHNPVEIYNWVHNTIEYIPTYGSIQGSDLTLQTLQTLRGNDFDTASLLIALLRASNIPARYVYGTIQVPIQQVENWVGGVTDPNAALNLLGQGGIPATGLVQGGQIKYVQMEHVWVEAWVNYIPSRAARPGPGDTWVPLDASFKQYTYTQGMDLQQAVPFDATAFAKQAIATGQSDSTGDWVQGIDQSFVQSTLTNYQDSLWSYVQSQKTNATVADVFGAQTIAPRTAPMLSAGLPYPVLVVADRMAQLPASLQAHVQLTYYSGDTDIATDSPSYSQQFALPDLAGKPVTLTYQSATAADQAVLDTAANDRASSFPAYLVNVVPVIMSEDQTLWTGTAVQEGSKGRLTVSISYQNVNVSRDYDTAAGDLDVLGFDPAGITPAAWTARTQSHNLSNGSITDYQTFVREMLYQAILGYWGELDTYAKIAEWTEKDVANRMPSFGMAEAPLSVKYLFGIAQSASYKSRMLDVKEDRFQVENINDEQAANVSYLVKLGYIGSYLESGICDQLFGLPPGQSMSAVTALGEANKEGLKIYRLDAANFSSLLNLVSVSDSVKAHIRNAVASGMTAYVPGKDITVGGFTGTGYILSDPDTGSGAYLISGGRDGNNSPAPPNVFPLPQVPLTPVAGIVMSAALSTQNAALAVSADGILQGIVIGGEAVAGAAAAEIAAAILLLALIVLLLYAAAEKALDTEYPKRADPLIVRKYLTITGEQGVVTGNVIWATAGGTFGLGVYFVNPLQELPLFPPVNPGVSCPLTANDSLQVARAYNIPRLGVPPLPELVEAYVNITFYREGYYEFLTKTNNNGAEEIVFTEPLVPWPAPENTSKLAMPIMPIFAQVTGWCPPFVTDVGG